MSEYIFTSESVSSGHPDKVADRISDAILDAILAESPTARAAIEVLITKGLCVIAGETSRPEVDAKAIARRVIAEIGYDPDHWDYAVRLQAQAKEIEQAVDRDGAGDQGLMFGYACNETDVRMPAAIHFSHRILEELEAFRRANPGILGPDAKSQVTLAYEDGRPTRVHTVLVSHQHAEGTKQAQIEEISRAVFAKVFPAGWFDDRTRVLINPSGSFVVGGPDADTGLTGRKIVVDTYGGAAPHGGGAFSGRIPRRWTAPRRTPRAGWRRTWWRRAWRSAAWCSSPTRSAWPSPSRSSSTPRAPAPSRTPASPRSSAIRRWSPSPRRRSAPSSGWMPPSTSAPPRTVTSAGRRRTAASGGSASTWWRSSAPQPASPDRSLSRDRAARSRQREKPHGRACDGAHFPRCLPPCSLRLANPGNPGLLQG